MQFFLTEIVARVVAIYLLVDCIRTLRRGLAERKLRIFNADLINQILDSFLDPSILIVGRDAMPIRYWFQIGVQISLALGCLGVAIFGWWQPDS